MRFILYLPRVLNLGISPLASLQVSLVTASFVLACMLGLSVYAYSAAADATMTPVMEDLSPGAELAWSGEGGSGQVGIGILDTKINIEAYNKKREKEIAAASRKLLSLAISLKSDLERNPDSKLSDETIRKAKEIEKLAHDVKESMKINIIGPE